MLLATILTTKLAVVVTSAVLATGSLTGVGLAANSAAPGDALYGLDCAMESVGLGDGGLQERTQEATKLVERGEIEKGLNHAALAIQNQAGMGENGQANGALVAAANAVQNAMQNANQGESDQMRARVAEMLQWMAETAAQGPQAQGGEFGAGVAERAREIAGVAEQIRTRAQLQDQTGEGDQTQTQTHTQTQSGELNQNQSGQANQNQNGQGGKGGK